MKRLLVIVAAALAAAGASPGASLAHGHWRYWPHAERRHVRLLWPRAPAYRRPRLGCGDTSEAQLAPALDASGEARRSAAAKAAFRRCAPCPSTGLTSGACPGYVVDHVLALKRGGADDLLNMQWQTTEQAKAKDKVE